MLSGGTFSASATAGAAVLRIVVSNDSMKKPTATNHGSRRLAVALGAIGSRASKKDDGGLGARESRVHDLLRVGDQLVQMRRVAKTLGIDLVDILGPRRPRGE